MGTRIISDNVHVIAKGQTRDPDTLRVQYLENS